MLNDPNPSSPANVDASVEWRDRKQQYGERCKKLADKATSELPAGIAAKIAHPDTDPLQREKRAQKIKLLNAPMTTLDDDDYVGGFDSDENIEFDYGDGDDFNYDDDGDQMSAEETGDIDREDQDD